MKYEPTFAEETFIVNGYGTDEDIEQFNCLMANPDDRGHRIEIIVLVEAIKQRNGLGLDWNCCWRCQRYNACEINWLRGEKALPRTCCPNCQNYSECSMIHQSQRAGRCLVLNPPPPVLLNPTPRAAPADPPTA